MEKATLYRYFNGKATPDEVHRIRQWASASAENAAMLRRERQVFNAWLVTSDEVLHTTSPSRRRLRLWLAAGVAAAIVALFALSLPRLLSGSQSSTVSRLQWVAVPAGQQAEMLLSDSSHVWLNARSRLVYPTAFATVGREVSLNGEAFFDVRHDDHLPFTVHAGDIDIRVLGTKFNVISDSASHYFEASLVDGRLRVELNKDNSHRRYDLVSGDQLSVNHGRVALTRITNAERYRWREGLYCFTNRSLADICNDIAHYYGVAVHLQNKAIAHRTVSGKFRFADGLDYNLSVLSTELKFKYSLDFTNRRVTIR